MGPWALQTSLLLPMGWLIQKDRPSAAVKTCGEAINGLPQKAQIDFPKNDTDAQMARLDYGTGYGLEMPIHHISMCIPQGVRHMTPSHSS